MDQPKALSIHCTCLQLANTSLSQPLLCCIMNWLTPAPPHALWNPVCARHLITCADVIKGLLSSYHSTPDTVSRFELNYRMAICTIVCWTVVLQLNYTDESNAQM